MLESSYFVSLTSLYARRQKFELLLLLTQVRVRDKGLAGKPAAYYFCQHPTIDCIVAYLSR
jgi:hypothetical protein